MASGRVRMTTGRGTQVALTCQWNDMMLGVIGMAGLSRIVAGAGLMGECGNDGYQNEYENKRQDKHCSSHEKASLGSVRIPRAVVPTR